MKFVLSPLICVILGKSFKTLFRPWIGTSQHENQPGRTKIISKHSWSICKLTIGLDKQLSHFLIYLESVTLICTGLEEPPFLKEWLRCPHSKSSTVSVTSSKTTYNKTSDQRVLTEAQHHSGHVTQKFHPDVISPASAFTNMKVSKVGKNYMI